MATQEPLSSVTNALRILREFTKEDKEFGITELSNRLGLAKSTIFRLVSTLNNVDLLEKNDETHKYYLGIGAFELGFAAYHRNELRLIAYPLLAKLMTNVRETVHLAVYNNGEVIYLSKLTSDNEKITISQIGRRAPSHCTASGKILLAHQMEKEIERVMHVGLKKYAEKTIVNAEELRKQLRDVRKNGYAISNSEYKDGVISIGVPVYNYYGIVIAAITLTMAKTYLYPLQIQTFVKELKQISLLITDRLD
ncbi:IclR family transcriptional regulator [Paenibacillus alginolyticus]|uniref:IclR family transcriptional regulator n=1 Tax=Paenibacillus alginolyticus TaxID=59839 RepID=A0ABT4GH09_9BACL|nr:IclR family transcriptional regulator [Paenibacillus alginolyticus]MCY9666789.1 IclR family transcriptional regulator [Paenibacillus alginolyticus]MCY9695475.1 IclR family transcriptional regulator [Paenibacillus alginolyticus]MEC0146336.1 IclR family transcriptional regulator [Paenibacillus alginolyticus]